MVSAIKNVLIAKAFAVNAAFKIKDTINGGF